MTLASTLVVQTGSGDSATVEKRQFVSSSLSHHVDYWIENDGANFNEQIELRISDNARSMANILKSYPRRSSPHSQQEEVSPAPVNIETITASVK